LIVPVTGVIAPLASAVVPPPSGGHPLTGLVAPVTGAVKPLLTATTPAADGGGTITAPASAVAGSTVAATGIAPVVGSKPTFPIVATMPAGSVGTTMTAPRPQRLVVVATAPIIQAILSSVRVSASTVILAGNRQWTVLSGTRSLGRPYRRAVDSPTMPAPAPAIPESNGTQFGTGLDGAAASGASFFFFGAAALHSVVAPIVPRAFSALQAIRGVGIAPPFLLLPERPG
jgi:hypothetical protein